MFQSLFSLKLAIVIFAANMLAYFCFPEFSPGSDIIYVIFFQNLDYLLGIFRIEESLCFTLFFWTGKTPEYAKKKKKYVLYFRYPEMNLTEIAYFLPASELFPNVFLFKGKLIKKS